MKVGQKAVVRWISKLVAGRAGKSGRKASFVGLREVSSEDLRHVGGGSGGSTQSPRGGW